MRIKNLLKSNLLFPVIVFVLALIPRIYFLNRIPPVMTQEEISVVMDAESFLATGVFVPGDTASIGRSNGLADRAISIVPVFILSDFLDNIPLNQFTARILFAIFSSAFSVIVFMITEKIFGKNVGILAGILMAINPSGIEIGRTANFLNFAVAFFGIGIYLMLFQKRWKRLYSLPFFILEIGSLSNLTSQPRLILIYLVYPLFVIFFSWCIVRFSGLLKMGKIISAGLLATYFIFSGVVMNRYFFNYPRSETVNRLFNMRLVSSYVRLSESNPNITRIYIATNGDIRSSLMQYLFYSGKYVKTGDIREVNDNIMKGRFEIGKVTLTNNCPVSVNAQAGEILIIDRLIPCPKEIENNSYINNPLIAEPIFTVYNDILCSGITRSDRYKYKTIDYDLEQMDKLEFCNSWVM